VSDLIPAVSLIVSTRGRQHQLNRLLQSLNEQSFCDFEVIIVEQNEDPMLEAIIKQAWSFPLRHLHTPTQQGASRGRNHGLAFSEAEFVLFPDDDCWYPPALLERGISELRRRNLDALTGRPTDERGQTIDGRYEMTAQTITRANVWTTQIEWLAFWRRKLLIHVGGFDEQVGVGATTPWQSAEGQDLMLRMLAAGARCRYDPTLNGHDAGIDRRHADNALIARARKYGRGMGFVMRKHRLGFGTPLRFLVRSMGGAILAAAHGRLALARYYTATAIGRLEGLLGRCLGQVN
jgi:glycosyltransferase involved in cell wall biosynthesis